HKTPDSEGDQTDEIEQNYKGNQLRKSNIPGELETTTYQEDISGDELTEEYQKLQLNYKRKENRSPSSKILRRLVSDKIKSILLIDERQEQRYWYATWWLIELLNLMQCLALIFVKSGVNPRFFKKATKCEYDKFLKELLNDEEAYHKAPKFDESLMDKIIE
ncbi:27086_t:CDS:2, partial [Dentiscutata erythropus]